MSTVLDHAMDTFEAAEALGVGERQVVNLITAGRLKAVRKRRGYILDAREVRRFAKKPRPVGNPNFGRKRPSS
jgi:excisionase family DNA binding protein